MDELFLRRGRRQQREGDKSSARGGGYIAPIDGKHQAGALGRLVKQEECLGYIFGQNLAAQQIGRKVAVRIQASGPAAFGDQMSDPQAQLEPGK